MEAWQRLCAIEIPQMSEKYPLQSLEIFSMLASMVFWKLSTISTCPEAVESGEITR